MRFKEFLLLEAGFNDSGSDWFYGSYLYPSDAFDWVYAQPHPADFLLLQNRWDKEKKQWGRKFHNIDLDGVTKTKYTSVYSNTMPEVGDGFWKHQDDKRPNLVVDNDAQLELKGVRKSAKIDKVLTISNDLIEKGKELDRLFGKFEPRYPEVSKDFDKPWKHKQDRSQEQRRRTHKKGLNNLG